MPQATAIVRPILSRGYGNTQSRFILLVPPLPFRSAAALLARNTLMHTCRRKEAPRAEVRRMPAAHAITSLGILCRPHGRLVRHISQDAPEHRMHDVCTGYVVGGRKTKGRDTFEHISGPFPPVQKIFANRTGVTPRIALHGYGSFSPSAQRPRLAQGQATPFSWSFPSRCRACPVK